MAEFDWLAATSDTAAPLMWEDIQEAIDLVRRRSLEHYLRAERSWWYYAPRPKFVHITDISVA